MTTSDTPARSAPTRGRALYVLSYDIADDDRRRLAAKRLERRAVRVQESVFEARLTPRELDETIAELTDDLDLRVDSLRAYAVCGECAGRLRALGAGRQRGFVAAGRVL